LKRKFSLLTTNGEFPKAWVDPSKAIKSVVEIIEAEFGMTAEEFREERRRRAEIRRC
jgi:hypothetical protein